MSAEVAAVAYIQARRVQRDTKRALRLYRQEHGQCEAVIYELEGPCYLRGKYGGVPEGWCDVCAGSQPLWTAYQHAVRVAAGVLRRALALADKEVAASDAR